MATYVDKHKLEVAIKKVLDGDVDAHGQKLLPPSSNDERAKTLVAQTVVNFVFKDREHVSLLDMRTMLEPKGINLAYTFSDPIYEAIFMTLRGSPFKGARCAEFANRITRTVGATLQKVKAEELALDASIAPKPAKKEPKKEEEPKAEEQEKPAEAPAIYSKQQVSNALFLYFSRSREVQDAMPSSSGAVARYATITPSLSMRASKLRDAVMEPLEIGEEGIEVSKFARLYRSHEGEIAKNLKAVLENEDLFGDIPKTGVESAFVRANTFARRMAGDRKSDILDAELQKLIDNPPETKAAVAGGLGMKDQRFLDLLDGNSRAK